LRLNWPADWEYRGPVRYGAVVILEARRQIQGETRQKLAMTIIDAEAASKPITRDAMKDLIGRLRDAVLATAREREIALEPLTGERGYYFTATDNAYDASKPGDYRQVVEGILLASGRLIHFTLLTNDARDRATRDMIAALDNLALD
jgi:hypothetical protein